jgi:citrate lyase synthetase
MRTQFKHFAATKLMLMVLFSIVGMARAEDVDEEIRALKNEVTRLEKQQAQLKADQLELKRDATEAAAEMPNFTYRPGNGLTIESADKTLGVSHQLGGQL